MLVFPLRAVWRENPGRRSDSPVQFLISVPKKRLRHAVDRVTMRRRIREAYRLLRDSHPMPEGVRIDLAFVYVDSRLQPYAKVAAAMERILTNLATSHDK
ncbi:MAG: ribonuclease P protein component [Clostridium sp.]|nr:ribonuclease P protein component [Clostridium sp.]